jgi:UPF0042 nucleotide-binding protein
MSEQSVKENGGGIIRLISFGFKYGLPPANFYFDVSFIKNPAREKKWGLFAIEDEEMVEYVLSQDSVSDFIDLVVPLIYHIVKLDGFQSVAFGCNSGRHRSPIVVNEIARRINKDIKHIVLHRDKPDYEYYVRNL